MSNGVSRKPINQSIVYLHGNKRRKILRILLCQSYLGQRVREPLVFPLGLAYIASTIKNTHDLTCFDPNISENPVQELSSVLEKANPEVVGLSLRNIDSVFSSNKRSYYPVFRWMIKQIKAQKPNCKLIVGGAGFSIFAEEIMKENAEIDFGVLSEGENSFLPLLTNKENAEKIPNIIFRKNDKTVITEKKAVNFESLPFPSETYLTLKNITMLRILLAFNLKEDVPLTAFSALKGFMEETLAG